jgi:hypothetical protein
MSAAASVPSSAAAAAATPTISPALVDFDDCDTFNTNAGGALVMKAFGLDAWEFSSLLRTIGASIFGGAALTWWKAAQAPLSTTVPEDQDLDIFVPLPEMTDRHYPICAIVSGYIEAFLAKSGYRRQTCAERFAELEKKRAASGGTFVGVTDELSYSALSRHIRCIDNFICPRIGRKIQFVHVRAGMSLAQFNTRIDLDISRFVVSPNDYYGRDYDDDPALFLVRAPAFGAARLKAIGEGQMRLSDTRTSLKESTLARIRKYYGRGYTLYAPVCCSHCGHDDEHPFPLDHALAHAKKTFEASKAALIAETAAATAAKKAKKVAKPVLVVKEDKDED